MTVIYNWATVVGVSSIQATSHLLHWINEGLTGWDVVRVIGCVEVKHFLNVASFPPSFRTPITAGLYVSTNITSSGSLPDYQTDNADWLMYQQIPLTAGFGVTSAVQSDLLYEGSVTFDSAGQRKLETDHPLIGISVGTWGDPGSPTDSYEPEFAVSATVHYLLRHNI